MNTRRRKTMQRNEIDFRISQIVYKANSGEFLDKDEQLFLGRILKKGRSKNATKLDKRRWQQAASALTTSNQRLVYKIARGMYKSNPVGTTLEDCIAEGFSGIARAMKTYDPDKGFNFSTYANGWIFHYVQRGNRDIGKAGRAPQGKVDRIIKTKKTIKLLGGDPSNPSADDLRDALKIMGISQAEWNRMKMFDVSSISLSGQVFDNGGSNGFDRLNVNSLRDDFGADSIEDPVDSSERHEIVKLMKQCLKDLPENEQKAVLAMYGPKPMGRNGEVRMTKAVACKRAGLDRKTFDVALSKGLSNLKRAISANGVTSSMVADMVA